MRAVRYYGKEDIRIEQVPEPSVGPGQVKIAPAWVGICGTDLHEYLGGPNFCPKSPHPITGESIPVTLGHEFAGVIQEVGPGVELQVGQACVIQSNISCGNCPACESSADNVCHSGGFIGLSGSGGGLSDFVCVNATHVFPLPDNLPLRIAPLIEPLSTGWRAVCAVPEFNTPDLNSKPVALVFGGGPLGLAVILCLKAKGFREIIVSEIATSRQDFAKEFGASRVVNPMKESVKDIVLAISNGRGADAVFDCAGVPESIKSACEAVKVKGTVVNVAIWEKEIPFNPNWITHKESIFTSVLGYQKKDFKAVIEMISTGAIEPSKMVTKRIKLENIIEDGFHALIHDKDNQVKILVDMHAS